MQKRWTGVSSNKKSIQWRSSRDHEESVRTSTVKLQTVGRTSGLGCCLGGSTGCSGAPGPPCREHLALGGVLFDRGGVVQQRVRAAVQSLALLHDWPALSALGWLSQ